MKDIQKYLSHFGDAKEILESYSEENKRLRLLVEYYETRTNHIEHIIALKGQYIPENETVREIKKIISRMKQKGAEE